MIAWVHQYRPRSAWYALSAGERDLLAGRWAACATRASDAGGTRGGPFSIRGQSLFERLEVWTFPTAAAAETYWSDLIANGYLDWRETSNLLAVDPGTANDPPSDPSSVSVLRASGTDE